MSKIETGAAPAGADGRKAAASSPKAAHHHHLIAGVSGGVVTSLVLHPIDLIKVRLQVQDGRTQAVRYTGIRHAIASTWQREGLRGFYRGVGPACWGSGLSWGLYFHFYESAKRRMTPSPSASSSSPGSKQHLAPWQHVYAAWEGGTLTCLLTNPIWLIKTRMQLQGQGLNGTGVSSAAAASASATTTSASNVAAIKPYRGIVDAVGSIVREEGFMGLYRGLLPALLLVSHGMIQFAVYEEAKRLMPAAEHRWGSDGKGAVVATNVGFQSAYLFAAAGLSKAIATTATYPYQVIKARLQQRFADASHREYTGFVDCCRKIHRFEGLKGFYRGFAANILRVAPQSAITLSCYEVVKRWLDGQQSA